MYVIDITRDSNDTDILCANDSMNSKNKILNYVIDYALTNYNINIDKNILDQNLNIEAFSLKEFLNEYYSYSIEDDLLIQSIITDKNNCIFVKFKDDKTYFPILYSFNKKEYTNAQYVLTFLTNDSLIEKYKDNITIYNEKKLNYNTNNNYVNNCMDNIYCNIISLYDKNGLFLEELLSSNYSLNQIINKNYGGVNI